MSCLFEARHYAIAFVVGLLLVAAITVYRATRGVAANRRFLRPTHYLAQPLFPFDVVLPEPRWFANPETARCYSVDFGWPLSFASFQFFLLSTSRKPTLPDSWFDYNERVILHPAGFAFDVSMAFFAVLPLVFLSYVRYSGVTRRMDDGLCGYCAYNLTGNVSGICPECGSSIGAAKLRAWLAQFKKDVLLNARFIRSVILAMFLCGTLMSAMSRLFWTFSADDGKGFCRRGEDAAYNIAAAYIPILAFAGACVMLLVRHFKSCGMTHRQPRWRFRRLPLIVICFGLLGYFRGCVWGGVF